MGYNIFMCFSASASFVSSSLLVVAGAATLKKVHSRSELLLALYPLLFAIIQFSEGIVWLTFRFHSAQSILNAIASYVFVIFSHVLWPTVVPASIYLIEKDRKRKKWLLVLLISGVLLSLGTLMLMIRYGVYSQIVRSKYAFHLDYVFVVSFGYIFRYVYLLVVSLPFFIATDKRLWFFGALWSSSFVAAFLIFRVAYISIWCLFAGILSLLIYLHFKYPKEIYPDGPRE
jgi:hypothetical protein